jgi:hypothetical protein
MDKKIICNYCGEPAELIDSEIIYGRSFGMAWYCRPCEAWVGCHKNSKKHAPLGRLANSELRHWKREAHRYFDPLWRRKLEIHKCSKGEARKLTYTWLAGQLGLAIRDCHIGMFDVKECKQTVEACKEVGID